MDPHHRLHLLGSVMEGAGGTGAPIGGGEERVGSRAVRRVLRRSHGLSEPGWRSSAAHPSRGRGGTWRRRPAGGCMLRGRLGEGWRLVAPAPSPPVCRLGGGGLDPQALLLLLRGQLDVGGQAKLLQGLDDNPGHVGLQAGEGSAVHSTRQLRPLPSWRRTHMRGCCSRAGPLQHDRWARQQAAVARHKCAALATVCLPPAPDLTWLSRRPWRAENSNAWWLLCQPSPNPRMPTHQLLRDWSPAGRQGGETQSEGESGGGGGGGGARRGGRRACATVPGRACRPAGGSALQQLFKAGMQPTFGAPPPHPPTHHHHHQRWPPPPPQTATHRCCIPGCPRRAPQS